MSRLLKVVLLGTLVFLVGCTWPRDPKNTTETVRGGVMVVGLSENPPWVTRRGDAPGGVEVRLIEAFAELIDAEIEWRWGSMTEHLAALAQYELHLVIGGLTTSSPGIHTVAATQPFYETRIVIGVPPGQAVPSDLDGTSVAVIRGTAVSDYVRSTGADPHPFSSASQIDRPAAVPHWQLDDLELDASGITLHTLRHVMAVPPGENQWLTALETFLNQNPPQVP